LSGVLVVGPSWVGDMIMAQSLFISLRRHDPEVRIDVLAPSWSHPILARMPQVRDAIEMPVPHGVLGLGVRWAVSRSLRARRYDRAIVLPRSLKSALAPFFARVPRRTGYRGEARYGLLNDVRPLNKALLTQTVQRFVALGQPRGGSLPPPVPHPCLDVDETNRSRLVAELGLQLDRPVVACIPGAAYGPSKRWPEEYFGELVRRLRDDGRQVWLLGGESDRETGQRIQQLSGGSAVDLTGRTRLEDVVDLLSLCEVAVTNDSGLMHVAGAVGARVVALYGSSTPAYTPPLTERGEVLYLDLDCSPCFERRCPLQHQRCLRDLGPERVLEATLRPATSG